MPTNFNIREDCPACGARQLTLRTLYRAPFDKPPVSNYLRKFYAQQGPGVDLKQLAGAHFHLVECASCKLVYQREAPGEALSRELYCTWIDPERALANYKKEGNPLWLRSAHAGEILCLAALLGKRLDELKVLDYGMGWGTWVMLARGFGCNVSGLEFNPIQQLHAASQGIDIVEPEQIPGARFDLINAEQVFEHLDNPLDTLKLLSKGLAPKGIIKISVPWVPDITRRARKMNFDAPKGSRGSIAAVAPLEHINYFRRKSLIKMASLAGLKEVTLPLSLQYRYLSLAGCGGAGPLWMIKGLMLPLQRNLLKARNYLIFTRG